MMGGVVEVVFGGKVRYGRSGKLEGLLAEFPAVILSVVLAMYRPVV